MTVWVRTSCGAPSTYLIRQSPADLDGERLDCGHKVQTNQGHTTGHALLVAKTVQLSIPKVALIVSSDRLADSSHVLPDS